MFDDAYPEQLWQRLVMEHPRATDEEIQLLFFDALIDNEDLRMVVIERFFDDIKKSLRSLH